MRQTEFLMRCTPKTTHTIARGSAIAGRPDPQHGVTFGAGDCEPRPIIENVTTLFKRRTVQKTGSRTFERWRKQRKGGMVKA
jgi:hypothetical protein